MISSVNKIRQTHTSACHEQFVSLLPLIEKQARFAFRDQPHEPRQELIAEVIANAFVAFVRLVERRLSGMVYATPLAQYAIKQVCGGRRVGAKLNVRDFTQTPAPDCRDTVKRDDEDWYEVTVRSSCSG